MKDRRTINRYPSFHEFDTDAQQAFNNMLCCLDALIRENTSLTPEQRQNVIRNTNAETKIIEKALEASR